VVIAFLLEQISKTLLRVLTLLDIDMAGLASRPAADSLTGSPEPAPRSAKLSPPKSFETS
jgi:hypothetical protein